MTTESITIGARRFGSMLFKKSWLKSGMRVEREALEYDASLNRYSVGKRAVLPNLIYSMELGAKGLLDVWPFFQGRLLDIGCGSKPYSLLINALVSDYLGLDLHPSENGNKVNILGDAQTLPIQSESFDTVLITDALEEIPSPFHVFREANRILKPDGHLIILVSHHYDVFNNHCIYAQYSAEGLRYLAEEHGFNVVLMKTKGKLLPFLYNLLVQLGFRMHQKIFKYQLPPPRFTRRLFFNFMRSLQKVLLKFTPSRSIRTDMDWNEYGRGHRILGSFHLGYLMVAKKVFNLD